MRRQTPTDQGRKAQGNYLLFSFLFPAALFFMIFAIEQVYPFGPYQAMVIDFYQQYFPFIASLQAKLQAGGSLLWTWNIGMGTNFIALSSYYLASPLNLLLVLCPLAHLREAMTLLLILRLGLAGLSCAYVLKKVFGRNDMSLVFFSMLYAVCGFIIGYFWNTIWLDSFALMPLVFLGTLRLMEGRGAGLYTFALMLSIWCNFLIGLYTCIFVLITFLCVHVVRRPSAGAFLRSLCRIAAFSALAIGMTAVITLPALLRAPDIYRPGNAFPEQLEWYASFVDVLGNFATMATPTVRKGLPNLFTGVLPILMLGAFLLTPRIPLRQRIVSLCVVAFLVVSTNLNVLNYLWNGFNYTIQLPFRFTFILSFVLVMLAFRTLGTMEAPGTPTQPQLIGMLLAGTAITLSAALGPQDMVSVYATAGLTIVYGLLFLLKERGVLGMEALQVVLLVLVLGELAFNAPLGYKAIGKTDHETYFGRQEATRLMLDEAEAADGDAFYRVELSYRLLDNEPALHGYHGVSVFSSTANRHVNRFFEGLGFSARENTNRLIYHETTPLSDALLGVRHFISREGQKLDPLFWEPVRRQSGMLLYENTLPLGLGFMMDGAVAEYAADMNPFVSQNRFLKLASGTEADLFDPPVDTLLEDHENLSVERRTLGLYAYKGTATGKSSALSWTYEVPEDGYYYAYLQAYDTEIMDVTTKGATSERGILQPHITPVGALAAGERVTLSAEIADTSASGTARVFLSRMNPEVYESAHAVLAAQPMRIVRYTDTEVEATIHARKAGLLYTSIPYESGWRAFVDGEEVQITPLMDAMLALPLAEGTHQIRLTYRPAGFTAGLILSLSCLAIAVLCLAISRRRRGGLSPLPPASDAAERTASHPAPCEGEEGEAPSVQNAAEAAAEDKPSDTEDRNAP